MADEEIVKGYEYVKGQHVLIDPKEIDELKLEAKHTIDMKQFVDEDDIDSRYWEKPYYLVQMVTRLTRAILSWHEPWPKQARSPLVNSSWGGAGASGRHQGSKGRADAFHPSLCR